MTAQSSKHSIRQDISERFRTAARVCFGAAILLLPIRLRIVLLPRPEPRIPADYTNLLLFSADIALLMVLTLWMISLIVSPRRLNWGPAVIWIPLAGLTLAGWASTLSSIDPLLSIYHAIRLLALFWFYVYIVNEIPSIRWVLIPVGIQVLIQSIVALGQFGTQHSLGLQSIGELYLDPTKRGVSIVAVDGLRLLRPYGLTEHPNVLGGSLAFGALIILAAYLEGWPRWAALPMLVIGAAALLVTFSRSAWLAFLMGALALVTIMFFSRRQGLFGRSLWLAAAGSIVLVPIVLINSQFFGVRLNAGGSFHTPSVEQQSIGERILLIRSFASIAADHPLLGVGLGTAPLALQVLNPDWSVGFEPPHLALLDAAVETGLPGAAFYLALMVAPFAIYLKRRSTLLADPLPAVAAALLIAVTVVGFFDYYTWLLEPGRLWVWLAWGLCAVALTPDSRVASSQSESSTNPAAFNANVNPTA